MVPECNSDWVSRRAFRSVCRSTTRVNACFCLGCSFKSRLVYKDVFAMKSKICKILHLRYQEIHFLSTFIVFLSVVYLGQASLTVSKQFQSHVFVCWQSFASCHSQIYCKTNWGIFDLTSWGNSYIFQYECLKVAFASGWFCTKFSISFFGRRSHL